MKNILAIVLILSPILLFAQTPADPLNAKKELTRIQRKMLARQHVEALKDGILIVRLKTQDKAIKKLESILSSSGDEAQKKRIRDRDLPKIKANRDELNQILRTAFDKNFKMGAVYFMPDTCTATFLAGRIPTCLTDATGKSVSGKVINQPNFVVIDYGQLSNDSNSTITGIIASDNQFEMLPAPFPYFQKNGGFFVQLSNKRLTASMAGKMVSKWQKRLLAYYNTAQKEQ